MHSIHPTAVVSKECELGDGVEIGPYCVISGRVKLGNGVRLLGHVQLTGPLTVGNGTTMYPFACIGFNAQDFKFKPGDPTAGVVIGQNSVLREYVTVHAATKADQPTRIGDNVLMMCHSHVGHDAAIDNRVILVNGASLAGHSHVAEGATLSAYACLHQFGRVGKMAFISASVAVANDVPAYCIVANRRFMAGLNLVGLRRAGMPPAHITGLRDAYRDAFRVHRTREDLLRILEERARTCPPVEEWLRFVQTRKRPIMPGFDRSETSEAADAAEAT
ncbi:MAG: acyl-ACP--UDP-N-acetylglucosamine O-acyltransferase [Phycisphaeraceae bacterium]|nr:acyl-ACP--UDP-N-acetylglucosamine O-acyltransferase [Phycisphaeraceae bacterium]